MDCATYREIVAADIDGQLDPTTSAEVREHLSRCARCASVRRAQESTKVLLRQCVSTQTTPAHVRERIAAALAQDARPVVMQRWFVRRGRLLMAGAVAAIAILAFLPRWRSSAPDLLDILVKDVYAATANEIPLVHADNTESLRRYYDASGRLSFRQTVPELDRLGFRPVGGAVVPIGDVGATFTVFEGLHGQVICRRFAVGAIALPSGGERVGNAYLYTINGVTIRIAQDGDAICCLASAVPRDVFLAYLDRVAHH